MFHKLLLDEPPLVVIPSLAKAIGLNEAIVLQQIHYWLQVNAKKQSGSHYHEGRYWTYNTAAEWAETFPFWGESTVRRIFASLEKSGIFLKGFFNEKSSDRTKWTSIDYDCLEVILSENSPHGSKSLAQVEQMGCSDLADQTCSNRADLLYTETSTKINYREKTDFSLSQNSNFENSENLEVLDLVKNPIPDQQGLNDRDPEKKESSAKERKTAAPPQIWSEQQILLAWNANRPKSWLPYSPGTLISPAVQNGLDHILQNFGGGDRGKTCEIIATTLKYISTNEAWLSSQHFTAKQSLSLEHGAGNKRFLGDYVPAALQALEKANKPQSVERLPLPLPTTSNNIFSAQIKELFNERCTEQ
jgi:hypothetical protein